MRAATRPASLQWIFPWHAPCLDCSGMTCKLPQDCEAVTWPAGRALAGWLGVRVDHHSKAVTWPRSLGFSRPASMAGRLGVWDDHTSKAVT